MKQKLSLSLYLVKMPEQRALILSRTNNDADAEAKNKKSHQVTSRIVFLKVGEIDTKNEKFEAEAYIESYWEDEEIYKQLLDSSRISLGNYQGFLTLDSLHTLGMNLAHINFEQKKHWSPELFIENSIGTLNEKIEHKLTLVKKDLTDLTTTQVSLKELTVKVTEKRKVEGFFYERLELHDFPIDLQEISLKLTSKKCKKKLC